MARRNAIIVLGVAVVFALLTAVMAYNWLQKRTATGTDTKPEQVAVAAADLSWGTMLTDDMVKMVPYLKASLPDGYFPDAAQVRGRTILYPMKRGELILESRLAPAAGKGGGVAAIVTPGKRAMAVKVDKIVGVSGFVEPGHRVDVLVTISRYSDSPVTKIVLENMLVIATGAEMEKTGGKNKPTQVDVVTLEVTPQEAEKLALAATEGKLRLALRSYGDKEDVATRGATIGSLLSGSTPGPAKAALRPAPRPRRVERQTPAAPAPAPRAMTVEVIRGNETKEVKFGNGGGER